MSCFSFKSPTVYIPLLKAHLFCGQIQNLLKVFVGSTMFLAKLQVKFAHILTFGKWWRDSAWFCPICWSRSGWEPQVFLGQRQRGTSCGERSAIRCGLWALQHCAKALEEVLYIEDWCWTLWAWLLWLLWPLWLMWLSWLRFLWWWGWGWWGWWGWWWWCWWWWWWWWRWRWRWRWCACACTCARQCCGCDCDCGS